MVLFSLGFFKKDNTAFNIVCVLKFVLFFYSIINYYGGWIVQRYWNRKWHFNIFI